MDVIKTIQKLVYEQLYGRDFGADVGVYSCPPREVGFPYILISMEESEAGQNFGYDAVIMKMKIKVLDRNENNIRILGISGSVLEEITNLGGISFENLRIVSIFFTGSELKLYSEIDPTWSNELDFRLLVKRIIFQ
ncbi:MAG: hypothetical protein LBB24_01665 [Rickettsiales bacterium]|jgi:hypothetical protein|nr:hypothetical protein [Rickettsiales bacterium]